MGEQIDQLQKFKNKLEKDKQTVKSELDDWCTKRQSSCWKTFQTIWTIIKWYSN